MKPHQPRYQTKGLAMGCRAVMGLGWVGTVAEKISAILELQKLEVRNSGLLMMSRNEFKITVGEKNFQTLPPGPFLPGEHPFGSPGVLAIQEN